MATALMPATDPKSTETVANKPAPITAEEFLKMDLREKAFELVEGEMIEMPPGSELHGRICFKVALALELFGARTGHGFVTTNDSAVVTSRDPATVRGADVIYYSNARRPESDLSQTPSSIPPDLVVEVVSPGNTAADLHKKIYEYLNIGVGMVWIVHPIRRTLTIYRPEDDATPVVLREADAIANLPELPSFEAKASDFFP